MEVATVSVSVPSPDFIFDSTCSTPYMSAPTSPKRFGDFYFSAPTSPTGASAFYSEFNRNVSFMERAPSSRTTNSSVIPFDWEEKPGKPKSNDAHVEKDEDFAFDFSGQLEKSSLTADELFDGGKIRPLKPPPRLQLGNGAPDESLSQRSSLVSSPRSPRSPIAKFKEAFSPKQRKEIDPFQLAIEESRKGVNLNLNLNQNQNQERGRGRIPSVSSSSSNSNPSSKPTHRSTRSLSPFRVSDVLEDEEPITTKQNSSKSKPPLSKRWRLRDFLLFRSASEGRASERDPLRKYSALTKKNDDVKNSSFRSTDSSGSGSGSMRRGPLSAHELHYKTNRAFSEELKKKTFLPYRQGLFGCMGFNPAVKGICSGNQHLRSTLLID